MAAAHRRSLVGRKFKPTSPNGKFTAGAGAIEKVGGVLQKIEVHGKNMFYFFAKGPDGPPALVVYVHFGMAGAFAVHETEKAESTANTRLMLVACDGGKPCVGLLSAMTVEHGSLEDLYLAKVAKLGPDPLREDADPAAFVDRCRQAKKSIGAMLMDQSCLAGVGNIYRTECLYDAGIHPEQPANTMSKDDLFALWGVVVRSMQAGFQTGSIWGHNGGPLCYNLETSSCGGKVRDWTMAGRNVYACSKRQVLDAKQAPAVKGAPAGIKAGTKHLGEMVAAVTAEEVKRQTGEGMAVQHVALKDDATLVAKRSAKAGAKAKKGGAGAVPAAKRVAKPATKASNKPAPKSAKLTIAAKAAKPSKVTDTDKKVKAGAPRVATRAAKEGKADVTPTKPAGLKRPATKAGGSARAPPTKVRKGK